MTSPSPTNVATRGTSVPAHTGRQVLVATLLLTILILLLPALVHAQSYVYVNNQDIANSISGFSVSSTGALSPVPGSPFATGGVGVTGTCYGLDRITVSALNNLLFVSNSGDQTISVLQIDPASGSLTPAPGSPFASGLTLDTCGGISLAATPDGQFLMASSNGQIQTFHVAASGILTSAGTTASCCSPTVGMKIAANGKLLAVSNEASVSVYAINADGSLSAAVGSPFTRTGTGLISSMDFSCAADRLYASEASFGSSSITDAWSADSSGVLSPVAGSPFLAPGSDSNAVVLSPDNSLLFVSDQFTNKITSFTVHADGTLASLGSFGGVTSVHVPAGLATDASGSFVFAADDTFGVAVFKINGTGSLTGVADVAINRVGAIQGLAAYPPRSCASADLALAETASPLSVEAGSNVTYTVTITNNGPATASATIVDNLPAGTSIVSCTATGGGVCNSSFANPHTITFGALASEASQTATIVAQTSTSLLNGASLTSTVIIGNKSTIDSDLTNNSASVTVGVTAQPGPTTLTVAPATGSYGGLAILTALLQKTSNGASISGKTVSFTLNGAPVGTAITNGVGQAILTISVAGLPLGTYPGAISASFAGDPLFNPSSGASDLTVNKAVLTVIPSSAVRLYGDPNPATFTYAISGFMNGDAAAVVSGTTTCSTGATITSPVGRYPVTCDLGSLSAANYILTVFPGTLIINPAPLTVTADNKTRVYGDPNPAFTGTVVGLKNGDVLTPTYSSAAGPVTPIGAYPIIPLLPAIPAAANYAIAYVNGTLTVTPAPLTVTVDNASRAYGDPNPVLTGTIVGIKNADNIKATYSTTATQVSPVGTYPITAALVDPANRLGNYTIIVNNGTLTITLAALTVNVDSFTRLYGDPNPVFTGTLIGVRNGDNITATYSSAATQASPIGVYPITATLVDPTLKLVNYTVTINNGTLTINPAPLSVTAANATRIYGNANPVFTGTLTGVKNGDNITATYGTTADPTSSVGTYAIVPTLVDPTGRLGNYTVTATNGIFTITPATLTVNPANVSRVYGDPNPALTGTLAGLKNADSITATYTTTATQASPVGTYPITATLSDPAGKLSNYTVTINSANLTITKAPLTVAGFSGSRPYGDPNPAPTITGIKNGDPITAGYSATSATQASPIGNYVMVPVVIDPTGALSNYTLTIQNGTMTINKAPLSVVANSVSRPYGSPNPALTGTITGIKNGDNITATFSTTATQTSNVGTTLITITVNDPTAKLSNYTLTTTNGVFTITAVPLTITANNQTIILGGAVANSAIYTGFVLGQTPANLNGNLSCSATKGTGNVGTFAPPNGIACSGQSSTNYTITFVQGTAIVQYEPAGVNCSNGPGHVILAPISAATTTFTKSTTPTIPLQFRVCGVNLASVSSSGVVSSFVLTSVNGTPASTPAPVGGPFTFVGGALANGAGNAGWQFNLSTSNLTAGNTYGYQINLNDGTSISLQFKLQ